jgi:hypothetical protein
MHAIQMKTGWVRMWNIGLACGVLLTLALTLTLGLPRYGRAGRQSVGSQSAVPVPGVTERVAPMLSSLPSGDGVGASRLDSWANGALAAQVTEDLAGNPWVCPHGQNQ